MLPAMTMLLLLTLLQDALPDGAILRLGPADKNLPQGGAALSPDGSWVAWAVGGDVRVYNASTGKLARTYKHGVAVRSVRLSVSLDVLTLTSGGELWSFTSGLEKPSWTSVPPLSTPINEFREFAAQGSTLIARSAEGLLYFGERAPWTLLEMEAKDLVALALGPSMEMVAATRSGKLFVHDLEKAVPFAETPKPFAALAFSAEGRLAGATSDGRIYTWDVGKKKALLDGAAVHEGGARGIAWVGSQIATAGVDGAVRLWSPETGKAGKVLKGHAGALLTLSASSDGARLATAGEDGQALIWKLP